MFTLLLCETTANNNTPMDKDRSGASRRPRALTFHTLFLVVGVVYNLEDGQSKLNYLSITVAVLISFHE